MCGPGATSGPPVVLSIGGEVEWRGHGAHSRATVEPLEDVGPGVPVQGQAIGHDIAHPLQHAAFGLHVLPQGRVPDADGGLQGHLRETGAAALKGHLTHRWGMLPPRGSTVTPIVAQNC